MALKFTFSSSNFNKVKKTINKPRELPYSVVERNVIAVCFFDLQRLWYVVPIDLEKLELRNEIYKFTNDSYKIKDGKRKYSTSIYNNKFLSIIELNTIQRKDKIYYDNIYMPFMAGVLCKGNLIKEKKTGYILFDLKDTTTDWRNPACRESIKKYIVNYELYKPIVEKYRNGEF